MRSNIAEWAELHRGGYFANHPRYKNRGAKAEPDLEHIGQFGRELQPSMKVVVIGSGYGREVALFAPLVRTVYAIDVCPEVLAEMDEYLKTKNVVNVVPVLAAYWLSRTPSDIDLFYSMATFQHTTKDLARDYLYGIADKLKPVSGRAIIQFADNETGTADAPLEAVEPNVRWSKAEITEAVKNAGLNLIKINTLNGKNKAGKRWTWHWAFIGPGKSAKEE
ncbi:MAG: class I SAM-dependent methyltransferase [Acidobacteria bacterium]|nr:class I SAM-dependent methyltransferase [Acidobacteriota bacterium]